MDLIELDFEGKKVGMTAMNLTKATITRFFKVHEEGLHLKSHKKWQRQKRIRGVPAFTRNTQLRTRIFVNIIFINLTVYSTVEIENSYR